MAGRPPDHRKNEGAVTNAENPYRLTDPVIIDAASDVAGLFRPYSGSVRLEPAEDSYSKHRANRLRDEDTVVFYADVPEDHWRRFSTFLTDTPCSRGKYRRVNENATLRIGERHENAVPVVIPGRADPLPRHVDIYMPTADAHCRMTSTVGDDKFEE